MIYKCYFCNRHIKSLRDYNESSYCLECHKENLLCHDCKQNLRMSQITKKHDEEELHTQVNMI